MKLSWHHSAIAALIALAPLTAAAAPAEVGTPPIVWQSVGTLSPAAGYAENIGVAGLVQGTFGDCIIVGGGANFPASSPLRSSSAGGSMYSAAART